MGFTYFKRFRMEIDLSHIATEEPALPAGYQWLAWQASILDRHAHAKYESFRSEIDAKVFPCLGNADGCRRLMQEIAGRDSFLPAATWLLAYRDPDSGELCDCGTIQGLAQQGALGAIQNVGIVPEQRRQGLGRMLVLKALQGFRSSQLTRAYLEVTARNTMAVNLYRSMGFQIARTVYKAVEEELPAYHS